MNFEIPYLFLFLSKLLFFYCRPYLLSFWAKHTLILDKSASVRKDDPVSLGARGVTEFYQPSTDSSAFTLRLALTIAIHHFPMSDPWSQCSIAWRNLVHQDLPVPLLAWDWITFLVLSRYGCNVRFGALLVNSLNGHQITVQLSFPTWIADKFCQGHNHSSKSSSNFLVHSPFSSSSSRDTKSLITLKLIKGFLSRQLKSK